MGNTNTKTALQSKEVEKAVIPNIIEELVYPQLQQIQQQIEDIENRITKLELKIE